MRAILPRARWRIFPIAAILLLLIVPAVPSAASPQLPIAPQLVEGSTTIIYIDSPTPNQSVTNGETLKIQGWAADTAGPGAGIAEVHIYLDGQAGQSGTALGAANYGVARPDVAASNGRTDWANTGYELSWTVSGLTPGSHTIYVYARSASSGTWQYRTVTINVTGPPPAPTPGPGMMPGMPPYGPAGPGGFPYGVTPPQNQLGGSPYGSGYPYGDVYGPSGRPCNPFPSPGHWGDSPFDPFDNTYCPAPPPPPPSLYPPGPPPPVFPGAAEVVPAPASPAGTVGLSWAGVPNASEYRIYQANNAFSQAFTLVKTLTQTLGSLNTSTTISGLNPGTTYFFSVRAVVNGIEQRIPASATLTGGTIGGPPPPGGLRVASQTNNSVTLTWIPVPGAVNYRVFQSLGTTGAFGGAVTSVISPSGTTVSGLLPNTQYTFRVSAIDSFGVEGAYAVVTTTTPA
jgi:hypothetical protein